MNSFWDLLLRSDLPVDLFSELYFAVFGLGDTSYERFCWPAKKLHRRLESLGAHSLVERGEGDEQHPMGIFGSLEPWIERLFYPLLALSPLSRGMDILPSTDLPSSRVCISEASGTHTTLTEPIEDSSILATLRVNRRMTAQDWSQDVRHLEFTFTEDIQYSPGDCASIRPEPLPDQVDAFLNILKWGNVADQMLKVKQKTADQSFPTPLPQTTTLRQIFTYYLDFQAVPRRPFFEYLRHFVTDEMEKDRLDEFLAPDGADDLYEYCFQVRRTVAEVLTEFRSACIPKDYLFDMFPPIRSREFSIASSIRTFPRQLHLCVAVVKYKTKLRVPREGVCSNLLARMQPGHQLQITLRKGLIKMPGDDIPLICVGPGTGVAPMRAVIQDRISRGAYDNTLYFGCRSKTKDFHYASEWEDYQKQGQLTLRVAFSRDGPPGVQRTYVQDLIRQDGERVWPLVRQSQASVFISGSSNKMPQAVRQSFQDIAKEREDLKEGSENSVVAELEQSGRWIEECWS